MRTGLDQTLDRWCRVLCRLFEGNVGLCREVVNEVSRSKTGRVWFARRLFAKNSHKRKAMSKLTAFLVTRLAVVDCQRPQPHTRASAAIAALRGEGNSDDETALRSLDDLGDLETAFRMLVLQCRC